MAEFAHSFVRPTLFHHVRYRPLPRGPLPSAALVTHDVASTWDPRVIAHLAHDTRGLTGKIGSSQTPWAPLALRPPLHGINKWGGALTAFVCAYSTGSTIGEASRCIHLADRNGRESAAVTEVGDYCRCVSESSSAAFSKSPISVSCSPWVGKASTRGTISRWRLGTALRRGKPSYDRLQPW